MALLALAGPAVAAPTGDALGLWLQDRLKLDHRPAYRSAAADLDGDGKKHERIVLIEDRGYCGSGGRLLLALAPAPHGWAAVMRATVSRAPIYLLPSRSHGWRDIGVTSGGSGAAGGLMAMRFDGRRYPSNPSLQTPLPASARRGTLLIGDGTR